MSSNTPPGFFRGRGHQPPDTGRGDVAPYLDFLHAGGSDYPAETLKRAGVDMRTPAPVEEALREFADLVGEMEQLLA